MPYVKKYVPPFSGVKKVLLGNGVTITRLAGILGVSYPTAKDRMEHPGKLSLDDLAKISRFGHIPIEELRVAIK